MRSSLVFVLALLPGPLALWSAAVHGATDFSAIDPILKSRCTLCHAGPAAPLALRLDSREGLLAGSSGGAVVVAGDPAASELVKRLTGESSPRMPMTGPPYLTDDEIALIEQWINEGARDSAGTPAPVPAGSRVRLHGTLVSSGMLDDVPIVITPSTRIDKSPGPGDYVQVRGRIDADGRIVVERLRPR